MVEPVGQCVTRHAQRTDINPSQIGSFQRHDLELRQPFGKERTKRIVVTFYIYAQLVEPVLALVIGRHQRLRSEGVEVAHLVDVDGTVDATSQRRVVTDDVGRLQACNVERLAGGVADDGIAADRSEGHEALSRHDEFAMYLVADDAHPVALADVVHALQLLPGPHASTRVVRVAEQEGRGLLVSTLGLEVLPVDLVGEG